MNTAIQSYYATPEQCFRVLVLMWELKFTPTAKNAYSTQYATYEQGVAMINHLEILKAQISKDKVANSHAFWHSIELTRVLGFTSAMLWMQQQSIDVSKRTGDYTKLTDAELREFNARCNAYLMALGQFID